MVCERRDCVVLTPTRDHISPACEQGLRELESIGYAVRRQVGASAIDLARSQMATRALRDGFSATIWIDSDIGFQADQVDQLRNHGLSVVGGVYPRKGHASLACHVLPGTQQIVFGVGGGVMEVLYLGAGFLFVAKSAYEEIQRAEQLPLCNEGSSTGGLIPYFLPLTTQQDGRWRYLAEDFAFCHRAKRAGIPIMADTTIRLCHFGEYGYQWEDGGGGIVRRFATYSFQVK